MAEFVSLFLNGCCGDVNHVARRGLSNGVTRVLARRGGIGAVVRRVAAGGAEVAVTLHGVDPGGVGDCVRGVGRGLRGGADLVA